MTKVKLLTGLALGILMAGCNSEEALEAPGMKTLKVQVEEYAPSTRVGFKDGTAEFFWTAGDAIGTTTDKADNAFSGMTLTAGEETGSATFKGNISGTPQGYAVYPYVENGYHQITAEGELTYQFPASYTYTQLDSEYGKTDGNSFNPPMWAQVIDKKASFKHLGGMFAIQMNDLPQGSGMQFIFTTSNQITGTFTTNLTNSEPILTTTESQSDNTVTINFSNNDAGQSTGFFYIPVPTGTYASITAVIKNAKGEEIATGAWSNQIVSRRVIIRGTIGEEEMTGGEASTATVSSASDVAAALAKATDVKVAKLSSKGNAIEMPASVNDEPVSIAFQSVESGASFTVEDNNTGGTPAASNVTISTPAIAQGNTAPEATFNMINSTITLSSNDENGTTYSKITAATAESTLIISQGVTVTTLDVKAGNVRLKKGGKIGSVSKNTENQSKVVYIILEEGADKPTGSVDDGCKVISAAEYDLVKACAKDSEYKLNSDVILTSPLVIAKEITLDLNGHSIKPSSDTWTKVLNTIDAVVLVRRGGDLTIEDNGQGSIDYNKRTDISTAVKLTDYNDEYDTALKNQAAKLTVNGGTLTGYYYGICGNGSRNTTEITIKGGTISGANTADGATGIFHPQDGTLNVSNGTISGATGIEMRAGKLNVTGGNIKSTATELTTSANNSGTTISGAAVAVSQQGTKSLNVTISGGTLTGPNALYEKYLQGSGSYDSGISLEVKGGTFNGAIYSENCSDFVTGGTFSDTSVTPYIAEDGNVNVELAKNYSTVQVDLLKKATLTVDLNGKTLTLTGIEKGKKESNFENGSTTTFKNGTITMPAGHKFYGSASSLTFSNITMSGADNAIWVQGPDAVLNITDGSSISAKYFPVSTNAAIEGSTPTYGWDATINLKDSEFHGTETGFMNNVPAEVTIDNCKFSGNHQAAFLRGGKYTITNSTFTLNASLESTNSENKHLAAWEEGNRAAFAGITIGNYESEKYQYPTTVSMKNVTVKVEGTYQSSFPAMHVCANAATDKGVTLTYDDDCSFSSDYTPAIEYGTTNIKVNNKDVTENNGKFTVPTE